MVALSAWANFYIIVGSSAGALIGLLFVVITLLRGRQVPEAASGIGAFSTPTVVHFGAVLFAAVLLSAPWPTLSSPALLLDLASVAGVAYTAITIRRLRRRISYQLVKEDWLWYGALPLLAYTALLVAALLLPGSPTPALFGLGAVQLFLLFIGIRNAWDSATYLAIGQATPTEQNEPGKPDGERDAAAERTA